MRLNIAIAATLAAIVAFLIVGLTTDHTISHGELPACQTEDQLTPDCHWDADTQGNSKGRSFEVRDGEVHYR